MASTTRRRRRRRLPQFLSSTRSSLVAGAANAFDVSADGFGDERERVICSEVTIDEWRRAVADAPKELPLPNMTAACLFGRYGASTHAGGLLRLWDAQAADGG